MSLGAVVILSKLDSSNGGPKFVRFSVVGDGTYPAGGSVGLSDLVAAACGDDREIFSARGDGPNGDIVLEYTPKGPRSVALTPSTSTDLFTTSDGSAHGLVSGDAVFFVARETANTGSPAAVPGGIADELTPYYVIATGLTTSAFKVSATVGGSAVDLADVGVGFIYFRKADKLLVRVMDTGVESAVGDQSGSTYKLFAVCE